jgi:hypothetical protein
LRASAPTSFSLGLTLPLRVSSLTRDRKTLAATSKTTVVTFGSELRLQIGLTCSPNAAEAQTTAVMSET